MTVYLLRFDAKIFRKELRDVYQFPLIKQKEPITPGMLSQMFDKCYWEENQRTIGASCYRIQAFYVCLNY